MNARACSGILRFKIVVSVFKFLFFLSISVFIAILSGCSESLKSNVVRGEIMGTTYSVNVITSNELDIGARSDLSAEIQSVLDAVDQSMSTYKPDSELMQLNGLDVGQTLVLTEGIYEVLSRSLKLMQETDGYFDPSIGPLVALWGFGANAQSNKPSDEQIRAALLKTGMRSIALDNEVSSVNKIADGFIDLSAIAKGFAVDQVASFLQEKGFQHFLVEVGGEVRVAGKNGSGDNWRLGIEQPDILARNAYNIAHISDVSMATSGDYRNFIESEGARYSHTINPLDGQPVFNDLASVTVIAEECADADAWATALMAMGKVKARKMAESKNLAVYFIWRSEDGFEDYASPAMQSYLKPDMH